MDGEGGSTEEEEFVEAEDEQDKGEGGESEAEGRVLGRGRRGPEAPPLGGAALGFVAGLHPRG